MNSTLMGLPTEIRLQIYRYIIPTKQLYKISVSTPARYLPFDSRPKSALLRRGGSACQASVLRLNRQTMREAYDIFYGENTFRFELEQGGQYGSDSWVPTLGTHVNPFRLLGSWARPASLIKKCRLFIRINSDYRHSRKAHLYLERWFADFAVLFRQHHPRLNLRISCGEYLNAQTGLLRIWLTNSYALEPLASLRNLRKVKISRTKHQIEEKLISIMTSSDMSELPLVEYEHTTYKRKKIGSNAKVDITRTLKKYHQARFDWSAIPEGQWAGRARRESSEMSGASSSASDMVNEDIEW